jgi:steroid 5-alpha reductase family enzyme
LIRLLEGWGIVAALMALVWAIQLRTKDAGIVDVTWAVGLGVLAAFHAALSEAPLGRRVLVAAMAGVWATRLALHLLFDRVLGKPEDGRYQTLRASWGDKIQPFFFAFFQAQALLDAILALSFVVPLLAPAPFPSWSDFAGLGVWAIAVAGEWLADRQLARFRAKPEAKGKTCREGLWRYSRHPNYFFEWLHWWSYPLVAWGAPWWGLTLVAPALMLFFLLRVTGIPATEAQALKSRGDDYRDYQRTTSAFIPWFPKKGASA